LAYLIIYLEIGLRTHTPFDTACTMMTPNMEAQQSAL